MTNEKNRILLVDDDPGLLQLLSIRLEAANYDVKTVENGKKALAMLKVYRPHLIITDLLMDGMDGMALFDAVHSEYPTLPVIILTAHGSIPEAVAATNNGVFGFLTKPFDGHELMEQVTKAITASGGIITPITDDNNEWRGEIITCSPIMEELLSRTKIIAGSNVSVLIQGESGTGKELLAKAIHNASERAQYPFIPINCGAIPESLLESELFGHRKGSFTGATQDHQGLFQAANGGTLFLDEIGDMPLSLQVKLLRVLQEQKIRPVGSTQDITINVRIISATHRNLEQQIEAKQFREDLYYRLNVVSLELPSLSQRREDIPLLVKHFITKFNDKYHKKLKGLSADSVALLVNNDWPGNIRQLHNITEQLVTLSPSPIISKIQVEAALSKQTGKIHSFSESRQQFERNYLAQIMKITGGNVTQAARLAKRNRTEFYKLLNKHDLKPELFKTRSAS